MEDTPKEPENTVQPSISQDQVTPDIEPKAEPKEVEPELVNAFGLNISKETNVELSSFADVQKFAEDNGISIKDVNDLTQVIKRAKTSDEVDQKLQSLQSINDRYETVIKGLPMEVALIFDAAISNGDWQGVISKIAKSKQFDYSKPFESFNDLDMVNRYNDEKVHR